MKSAERFIEENPRATAEQREAVIKAYRFAMKKDWFDTPAEARDWALRFSQANANATQSQLEARLKDLENACDMALKFKFATRAEAMEWAECFIDENPAATAEQREAIINAYTGSAPSRTHAEARKQAVDSVMNAYKIAAALGLATCAETIEWALRFMKENPGITAEQRELIIKAYKESIPSRTPAEARKQAVDSVMNAYKIKDCFERQGLNAKDWFD